MYKVLKSSESQYLMGKYSKIPLSDCCSDLVLDIYNNPINVFGMVVEVVNISFVPFGVGYDFIIIYK